MHLSYILFHCTVVAILILDTYLSYLYRLTVGQYIMKNSPRKQYVNVLKAAPNKDRYWVKVCNIPN